MTLRDAGVESRDVLLTSIDEPDLPSRASMDEKKLEELAANIRRNGLLQPLILVRAGERYKIIAGHRRFLAAGRAGLARVPCRVYSDEDAALEAAKYAENRFREELNPADEAIYFHQLLERDCAGDVDRLCEQLGEKRSYVEARLNLVLGDERILEALQLGQIGVGVAQELNKLDDEKWRRYLLTQAITGGATQTVVRGWLEDYRRQRALLDGLPPSDAAPALPSSVTAANPFLCACCLSAEHVHLIVHVPMHQHCKLAIFDPFMARFRGE